jgi:hypothetical protein
MTRSIFDPGGGETERSGSTHTGPAASNISHIPPDVVDGEVGEEEIAEAEGDVAGEEEAGGVDASAEDLIDENRPNDAEESGDADPKTRPDR